MVEKTDSCKFSSDFYMPAEAHTGESRLVDWLLSLFSTNKWLFMGLEMIEVKVCLVSWAWWHMPLKPALRSLRQADLYEFDASLVCGLLGSSRLSN